jgi:inhibitor of KinA sporulation pathway (predicted exonuclease)
MSADRGAEATPEIAGSAIAPVPGARIVVLDLEATCDSPTQVEPMETIEIGAVALDGRTLAEVAHFQAHVRPRVHPRLTPFCTALTGIEQATVDAAPPFPEAVERFHDWIGSLGGTAWWGAWGDWDRAHLAREAGLDGIALPLLALPYANLKAEFSRRHGGKRIILRKAVKLAGLSFEGRHHCGLDDARMTARLLPYLLAQPPAVVPAASASADA